MFNVKNVARSSGLAEVCALSIAVLVTTAVAINGADGGLGASEHDVVVRKSRERHDERQLDSDGGLQTSPRRRRPGDRLAHVDARRR